MFGGMPARSGVTSALLVRSGWTGVDDIFSGPDNFFQAYAPNADPALLVDKLGERYEIMRTNIKKWTVGSPIQSAARRARAILRETAAVRRRAGAEASSCGSAPAKPSVVNNRDIPDICLQHMVAVMLIDKHRRRSTRRTTSRACRTPACCASAPRSSFVPDAELERRVREAIVDGRTLADGTRLSEHVRRGARHRRQSDAAREEVVAKCRDLIAPVHEARQRARKLIDRVLALESAGKHPGSCTAACCRRPASVAPA